MCRGRRSSCEPRLSSSTRLSTAMRELSGLTALVTGASRGIGVYIARALAREKMQLALAARSAAELNALAAELSGQGVRAQAFVADVAAPESAAELVERVRSEEHTSELQSRRDLV